MRLRLFLRSCLCALLSSECFDVDGVAGKTILYGYVPAALAESQEFELQVSEECEIASPDLLLLPCSGVWQNGADHATAQQPRAR